MRDGLIIANGALSRRTARMIEAAPGGYTIQCKQLPREIQGRYVEFVFFDELTSSVAADNEAKGGKDE